MVAIFTYMAFNRVFCLCIYFSKKLRQLVEHNIHVIRRSGSDGRGRDWLVSALSLSTPALDV